MNQAHGGLAQSGPLDAPSARPANALCDNPSGTTLLECTLTGPLLVALRPLIVGDPARRSMMTSSTAPATQRTSLTSPCGAVWKCMPRTVPLGGCRNGCPGRTR